MSSAFSRRNKMDYRGGVNIGNKSSDLDTLTFKQSSGLCYNKALDSPSSRASRVPRRQIECYVQEYKRSHNEVKRWKEEFLLADGAMRDVQRKCIKAEEEKEELNKTLKESRSKCIKFHEMTTENRSKNAQTKHASCTQRRSQDNTVEFKKLQAENKNFKKLAVERANKLKEAEKIYEMKEKIVTLEAQLNKLHMANKIQKDETFFEEMETLNALPKKAHDGAPLFEKDKIRVLNLSVKSDIAKLLKLKLANKEEEISNLKAQCIQAAFSRVKQTVVESWLTCKVSEQQGNENIAKLNQTVDALKDETAQLRNVLKGKLHEIKNAEDKLQQQKEALENIESQCDRKVATVQMNLKDLDLDLTAQKQKNECLISDLERVNGEKEDAVSLWKGLRHFVKSCNDDLELRMDLRRCEGESINNDMCEEQRLQRNLQTMARLIPQPPENRVKIRGNKGQNRNAANFSSHSSKAYSPKITVKQEVVNEFEFESSPVDMFQEFQYGISDYLANRSPVSTGNKLAH